MDLTGKSRGYRAAVDRGLTEPLLLIQKISLTAPSNATAKKIERHRADRQIRRRW